MKEVVVISGKGGTGKTSIVSAFASLAKENVLCDADVDAADLHLILSPQIKETHEFISGHTAVIDKDMCIECGLCRSLCKFSAIDEDYNVDPIACEGCGVCVYFCPEETIRFPESHCGNWFKSETRFGPMVHAALGIAEENSGKLVTLVRRQAKELAEEKGLNLILTDGPPGIGCPVIAAIGGASTVLIVVEPTISGKHDLKRVAGLAAHFKVPAMVCVNKWDINPGITAEIEHFAHEHYLPVSGRIPFDPAFTTAMVQGKSLLEIDGNSPAGRAVRAVWESLGV